MRWCTVTGTVNRAATRGTSLYRYRSAGLVERSH